MCIFQRDKGDDQVALRFVREVFVVGRDVGQQAFVQFDLVTSLFECDAENIFVLDGGRAVGQIDFDDIVSAFPFILQDFKCLRRIVGSNDAVGNFAVDKACSRFVACVAECDEVAVRRHAVGTAGAGIGGCKRSKRKSSTK